MYCNKKNRVTGFTLVELLVVVIILAVLASIVVPQFSDSTNSAKESALDSTLNGLRNAIELYYHQHGGVYPGQNLSATGLIATTPVAADVIAQLTLFSQENGKTSSAKTGDFIYGPYLKKQAFPINPIDNKSTMVVVTTGALDATVTNVGGWWYDAVSGKLAANITAYAGR